MNKKVLTILACAAIVAMCAMPALTAEVPFQKTVTVTNGVGSWSYDAGVNNAAFSAFRPTHFWFRPSAVDTGLCQTVTVKRVRGTVTNSTPLVTMIVVSNAEEAVFYPTNTQWLFRSDKLLTTFVATNSRHGSMDVTGVEQ
jgi:hypothetical protein